MSLNFNRYASQQRCEAFVACQDDFLKWEKSKKQFENLCLTPAQSILYSNDLRHDSVALYKKGIHSLFEAIKLIADKKTSYSWASVILYYSVYYFLRASLAAKGIGLIRNGGLYFLNDAVGSVPEKKIGKNYNTTHGGAIFYSIEKNSVDDVLLSNDIDGCKSYIWMKEIREIINYRQNQFDEPSVPEIWKEIDQTVSDLSFFELLENYIDDKDLIFCFQEDHAILALPIKKAFLTKEELDSNRIDIKLTEEETFYFYNKITNRLLPARYGKLEKLMT